MSKVYVGIDPGKNGGIAYLWDNGDIFTVSTPKKVDDSIDWRQMRLLLENGYENIDMIAYEQLHSIHGTSASSNFEFGKSNGGLDCLVQNLDIPFVMVQPKEWQKYCFKGIPVITKKGKSSTDTKAMSALAAGRLAPTHDFVDREKNPRKKIADDGLTDAFLIAWWLKNEYLKK